MTSPAKPDSIRWVIIIVMPINVMFFHIQLALTQPTLPLPVLRTPSSVLATQLNELLKLIWFGLVWSGLEWA
ncbi:hypothetical protein KKH23_10145, partial [Patescibacteria group bacterium]|nr:hypothetical protein [Patescibacteria group bacterium]